MTRSWNEYWGRSWGGRRFETLLIIGALVSAIGAQRVSVGIPPSTDRQYGVPVTAQDHSRPQFPGIATNNKVAVRDGLSYEQFVRWCDWTREQWNADLFRLYPTEYREAVWEHLKGMTTKKLFPIVGGVGTQLVSDEELLASERLYGKPLAPTVWIAYQKDERIMAVPSQGDILEFTVQQVNEAVTNSERTFRTQDLKGKRVAVLTGAAQDVIEQLTECSMTKEEGIKAGIVIVCDRSVFAANPERIQASVLGVMLRAIDEEDYNPRRAQFHFLLPGVCSGYGVQDMAQIMRVLLTGEVVPSECAYTVVRSPVAGEVMSVTELTDEGFDVWIQGLRTPLLGLETVVVRKGMKVEKGQFIGLANEEACEVNRELSESQLLVRYILKSTSPSYPAIEKVHELMDEELLAVVAVDSTNSLVCHAALAKLADQDLLARVAQYGKFGDLRACAVTRLTDQILRVQIAMVDNDYNVQVAAVRSLSDERLLCRIAVESEQNEVCEAALTELTDPNLLAEVAQKAVWAHIRKIAISRLSDQDVLSRLASECQYVHVRSAAVDKLDDQAILARIAIEDPQDTVRQSAVARLADQSVLARLALEDGSKPIRMTAVTRLVDQSILAIVASKDEDAEVRAAAASRLVDKAPSDRMPVKEFIRRSDWLEFIALGLIGWIGWVLLRKRAH